MILGVDTSNYKTSIAVINEEGMLIADARRFLTIKSGERGLRQSEAFFQHVNRLPGLLDEALAITSKYCEDKGEEMNFTKVAVSTRPRSVEGSYMPCFAAGESFAKAFARGAGAQLMEFSHQDGHIAAVKLSLALAEGRSIEEGYNGFKGSQDKFASFHFSGGTTEALICKASGDLNNAFDCRICGGTKDISYGQFLDRIGVKYGLNFPCGKEMDELACKYERESSYRNLLPKIKVKDGYINLSGIETNCQRLDNIEFQELCYMMFERVCESIVEMIYFINDNEEIVDFYVAGGVASSEFVRMYIEEHLDRQRGIKINFADPSLSADNAVGVAMLGGLQWL